MDVGLSEKPQAVAAPLPVKLQARRVARALRRGRLLVAKDQIPDCLWTGDVDPQIPALWEDSDIKWAGDGADKPVRPGFYDLRVWGPIPLWSNSEVTHYKDMTHPFSANVKAILMCHDQRGEKFYLFVWAVLCHMARTQFCILGSRSLSCLLEGEFLGTVRAVLFSKIVLEEK